MPGPVLARRMRAKPPALTGSTTRDTLIDGLAFVEAQPLRVRQLEDQIVVARRNAGAKLRELRLAMGMSLNDIAKHARRLKIDGPTLQPGTVSRLETAVEWRPLVVGAYVSVLRALSAEVLG